MTRDFPNTDGSDFTIEDTKDAVDNIETAEVTGSSAEEAAEVFQSDRPPSNDGELFPVGTTGIRTADLGGTRVIGEDGEAGVKLADGYVWHPPVDTNPLLSVLLLKAHEDQLAKIGYPRVSDALGFVSAAIVPVGDNDEPAAIYFPEASNVADVTVDQDVRLDELTYARIG